jgi:very-short-patch-repair endonuclease
MSSESISLCPICSKRRVIKGINDIATTHPKVIEYFVNIKDAYKYSYGSSQEVSFKCLNCGAIKKMKINQLIKYGFSCKNCSDGISYCEKFMQNVLSQLNIKNIFQLSRKHFEWVENYRYDFYIPSMNLIIEMDGGLGHGKDNNMSGQSGKESKAVDDYKDRLAREHGIEVIRIGCNYGKFLHRFKYIKDNIISKLDEVLDLSKINWEQCDKNSLSSKVIEVCELWNKYKNTGKIKEVVNLNKTVIRDYLKRGTELNLCMYDPKLEMIKNGKNSGNHLFKKIICLENNMIFNSANECREKSKDIFGVELSEIVLKRYCNKKIPYKNLHFLFLDDYKTITKEEMSIFREKKNDYLEKISKHVLCLETGDIFKSVMDCERMSKYVLNTKIGSSSISLVCSGKQKSTKGFHFKFVSDLTPEERIKYNIDDKLQESQEEIK